MSSYTQMHKKGGGSTSSTCSMDSLAGVKASEGSSKQMTGIRAHEPQREPLRQTENVLRTQNNAIRTENSVNKVWISKTYIKSFTSIILKVSTQIVNLNNHTNLSLIHMGLNIQREVKGIDGN